MKIILKRFFCIILICALSSVTMLFSSCKFPNNPNLSDNEEILNNGDYNFTTSTPSFAGEKSEYSITYGYSDNYFRSNSFTFNIDLARLSLGLTSATRVYGGYQNLQADKYVNEFYDAMEFDDIYINEEFYSEPNEKSIGVTFAKKQIDDFYVIAVSIRGYYDNEEWINNFVLSESGHHYGFKKNANYVYTELKKYINNFNFGENDLKIWVTGYSRSAAIAELLGIYLNEDIELENLFNLKKENIFIYTFEAPQGVDASYSKEIKNVHNIVNGYDLIIYTAPSKYNLKRVGKDYDISFDGVLELVKSYDDTIKFDNFREKTFETKNGKMVIQNISSGYSDPKILYTNFFEHLLIETNEKYISVSNRNLYVSNLEDVVCGLLRFNFTLNTNQREIIGEVLTNNIDSSLIIDILLNKEDVIYNILIQAFDSASANYNDVEIKCYCEKIQGLIYTLIYGSREILNDIATIIGNADYIGLMHNPIVTLLLLDEYARNQN